jgi:hypothetical protein
MTTFIAEARKALAAAVAAGVAVYLAHGYPKNQGDWALLVGSVIVAGVMVFFIPNQPPAAKAA